MSYIVCGGRLFDARREGCEPKRVWSESLAFTYQIYTHIIGDPKYDHSTIEMIGDNLPHVARAHTYKLYNRATYGADVESIIWTMRTS